MLIGRAPPHVEQFLDVHCLDCHGGDTTKGGLDLSIPASTAVAQLSRWSKMRQRVHAFEMPPVDSSDLEVAERSAFTDWVDEMLDRDVPRLPVDPGQVTVRRLSRGQWQNTVQDLLGVEADATGFPADDLGYGFDSIGDALTFSTLHLEKYLAASHQVARDVFHGEDPKNPQVRTIQAESMHLVRGRGGSMLAQVANLFSNATIEQWFEVPRRGQYRFRIIAGAKQAGDEPAKMRPTLDGKRLEVIEVPNRRQKEFYIDKVLDEGRHKIALSFINDFYEPKHPDPRRRDRNLLIDSVAIIGPVDARIVPVQQHWLRDSIRGRTDVAKLKKMVLTMLPILWRRTVTSSEVGRLQQAGIARIRNGESLLAAQRFVLTAALTSPNFLFRIEQPSRSEDAEPIPVKELIIRLSYFLWASAPDQVLRSLGKQSGPVTSEVLLQQVTRMLVDPRAKTLASEFATQWLELRAVAEAAPDPARFAGFDDSLRSAVAKESELLFLSVLKENRDVGELIDCDYTFVNQRLAEFYGLPHEGNPESFVRTELRGAAKDRGGLLGHASIHAITSNPTRTSPVKRGKWILENLLGQAPPPPPPGNDSFQNEEAIDDSKTLRQQMAQHRESSKCAVCHLRMDALGLALERYDVIGRYRSKDGAGEIDASGELPDGRRLEGLADLKSVLKEDPAFVRTVARKLFVYAIGRDLRPADRLRIDLAVRLLVAKGKVTLKDLVLMVVMDPAFGQRIRAS